MEIKRSLGILKGLMDKYDLYKPTDEVGIALQNIIDELNKSTIIDFCKELNINYNSFIKVFKKGCDIFYIPYNSEEYCLMVNRKHMFEYYLLAISNDDGYLLEIDSETLENLFSVNNIDKVKKEKEYLSFMRDGKNLEIYINHRLNNETMGELLEEYFGTYEEREIYNDNYFIFI